MFTCTIGVIHVPVCHLTLVSQQCANANHVFGDSSKRHKLVFWTQDKGDYSSCDRKVCYFVH